MVPRNGLIRVELERKSDGTKHVLLCTSTKYKIPRTALLGVRREAAVSCAEDSKSDIISNNKSSIVSSRHSSTHSRATRTLNSIQMMVCLV